MIYFIGDTHFGHENVIKHSNRPFNTVEEMDKLLIENWNATVKSEDIVYVLGDFWYKGRDNAISYIRKLKGKKHLIKGNHDNKALKNPEFVKAFESINDILEIVIDNERVIMCHYPIAEWNGYFRGSLHIHGHIHNNRTGVFKYLQTEPKALNSGVDIIGFKPVSLEVLKECNLIWKNK